MMVDDDVARFVVADSAVEAYLGGFSLPAGWRQMAAALEAEAAEVEDSRERWWVRRFEATGEYFDASMADRGLSPELSRRFVDPIVAAALARGDLPTIPHQTAAAGLHTRGNQAWQRAYNAAVGQVAETALRSRDEAGRLLAIGDANWEARDVEKQDFESVLTAAGASPQETRWLHLAASARPLGWDSLGVQQNEALRRRATAGLIPPGGASGPLTTAAQPPPREMSGLHARQGKLSRGE